MSQATKVFSTFLQPRRGMHSKTLLPTMVSTLAANVDEGVPLALKAKVGSFLLVHSPTPEAPRVACVLESDPNFCPVDVELRKRLHFESVGSAHLLPSRRLLAHIAHAHGVTKWPSTFPSPGVRRPIQKSTKFELSLS